MTDNELNALVAERVMGLRIAPPYCNCVRCQKGINVRANEIPDCANDIAAAFQVVEKMISNGYEIVISKSDGTHWVVLNSKYSVDGSFCRTSDLSASRAICLAALDAMGVKVEG